MNFKRIFTLSNIAIFIVLLACCLIDAHLKNWTKKDKVIENDVFSYYAYLPGFFIYNDIAFKKNDNFHAENLSRDWALQTKEGFKVIKMTMGLSMLYAPFFFIAHGTAMVFHYPATGYSEPYKLLLLISSLFYLVLGLIYIKKILLYYSFADKYIAATIALIGLGTNLLCYASQDAPMSHAYNFFLFAAFVYYTIKWHEIQSAKNTIIIGLLLGLISLVRPSNAVVVIFFVLYGISNWKEFKQKLIFFKKEWFLINVIGFIAFIVWIPQMLYWKTVSGSYFYYSYMDEGFFFSHPKILEGLFSFRKGWLVYTPIMVFSLVGIFFLRKELIKARLAIIIFFIINIYVIFSWWCWWYGGSFGQRSMIESYAVMAIPFAAFTKYMTDRKWYYQVAFYCIALFLVWLNIFQTFQSEIGSLHYDSMTKELYFKQFGKLGYIRDYDKYVSHPDYDEAKRGNSADPKPVKRELIKLPNNEIETDRKKIQLKAFNNKYVCADKVANYFLFANRDHGWDWETFTLILFGKNDCSLLSFDNHFVSEELKQQNEITATRTSAGFWETFVVVNLDSDCVAFRAVNGKYLSVDEKTFQLFARAESIGKNEKFQIIYQ